MTEREQTLRAALSHHRRTGALVSWRRRPGDRLHRWAITDHTGTQWMTTREAERYVQGLDAAQRAADARLASVPSWEEQAPALGPTPVYGDRGGGRLEYLAPTLVYLGPAIHRDGVAMVAARAPARVRFAYTERRRLVCYEGTIDQSTLFRLLLAGGTLNRRVVDEEAATA
jgi:hypothetical protein